MKSPYHEGELSVQARAGVQEMAARIGNSIRSTIPLAAQEFLSSQPMAVLASVDAHENVWASLLTGTSGFMRAVDDRNVEMNFSPIKGDPLAENIKVNPQVGLIVIEFATRRRMRINGIARIAEDSKLYIQAEQVYSNCPKYIQARTWKQLPRNSEHASEFRTKELTDEQQNFIERADTFFIATHHKEGGADASHRGGNPGFVRVLNKSTLIFPDYSGNTMFQTLGNISVNPNCGLLFINFEKGSTIQMSGTAKILWEPEQFSQYPGAERAVEFRVTEIVEISQAISLQWDFINYSTFNPK